MFSVINVKLILASSSPRRKDILNEFNYKFDIIVANADETMDDSLSAIDNVKSVALRKAKAIGKMNDSIVLGCDTIVVIDGKRLGKPHSKDEAYSMLKSLSGRMHEVVSGVAIIFNDEIHNFATTSKVYFKNISDDEIWDYISTNEPMDKAGAYAIQGIGGKFVDHFEGSEYNIIGLPIEDIKPILDKYYYMWKIRDVYIPNQVVLAPMAGICNEAFRRICKSHGAGLMVAEMVSDKALGFSNEKTIKMTKVSQDEHPISMQIFGADVESLVYAAKYLDNYSDCDIIDINMGCPVNKVAKKAGAGASLLKNPDHVYEIVKAVVEAVKKPVTVKIRIGWDSENINAVENAKLIEKAGASAIAVHGRTRAQMYSGEANYDVIKAVKEAVSIPVIANGDINSPQKAKYVLEYTGCDAVMIARGAQGNPFIFEQINEYLMNNRLIEKPTNQEIYDTIMLQHSYLVDLKGEKLAMLEMRTHISAYLKGLPGSATIKNQINTSNSFDEVNNILKNYLLN